MLNDASISTNVPLIDIQSAAFAEQYERGVWWSMYGEGQGKGPFSVCSLRASLESYSTHCSNGQHDPPWHPHLGYLIGMYHGAVLSTQTSQLRPDVSTLIALDSPDVTRGYRAGREAFFHEVESHYRYSEQALIEYLHELVVEEEPYWNEESEGVWNYTLGCLFGELSGFLFPETPEEAQAWRKAWRAWEQVERQSVLLQEA